MGVVPAPNGQHGQGSKPAVAWLFTGLFTPVMGLIAWIGFPHWSGFAKSTLFCVNSFTLPAICFHLIWNVLNLTGRRRTLCLLLLALNAGLLLWLAWHKALIWVWWNYE